MNYLRLLNQLQQRHKAQYYAFAYSTVTSQNVADCSIDAVGGDLLFLLR